MFDQRREDMACEMKKLADKIDLPFSRNILKEYLQVNLESVNLDTIFNIWYGSSDPESIEDMFYEIFRIRFDRFLMEVKEKLEEEDRRRERNKEIQQNSDIITLEDINKVFPDSIDRSQMTEEREKAFVEALFYMCEQEGFAKEFRSDGGDFKEYDGKSFQVLGRTEIYDPDQPTEHSADLECLPMWTIRFEDGKEIDCYPEEIVPSLMS